MKCCVFLITSNSSSCLHVLTSLPYSLAFGIIRAGGTDLPKMLEQPHNLTSLPYSLAFGIIRAGGPDFPKMLEQPHNCRRQTGEMKQGAKLCSGSLRPTEMYARLEFVPLSTNNTQLSIDSN